MKHDKPIVKFECYGCDKRLVTDNEKKRFFMERNYCDECWPSVEPTQAEIRVAWDEYIKTKDRLVAELDSQMRN